MRYDEPVIAHRTVSWGLCPWTWSLTQAAVADMHHRQWIGIHDFVTVRHAQDKDKERHNHQIISQTTLWQWKQPQESDVFHVDWFLDLRIVSLHLSVTLCPDTEFYLQYWDSTLVLVNEKKLEEKDRKWDRTDHLMRCCETILPAVCWQSVDKSLTWQTHEQFMQPWIGCNCGKEESECFGLFGEKDIQGKFVNLRRNWGYKRWCM